MAITNNNIDLIANRLTLVIPSKKDIQDMEKRLNVKYDRTIKLLDKIAGELKTKREEQEVHAKQHADINDKLESIGNKLNLDLSY